MKTKGVIGQLIDYLTLLSLFLLYQSGCGWPCFFFSQQFIDKTTTLERSWYIIQWLAGCMFACVAESLSMVLIWELSSRRTVKVSAAAFDLAAFNRSRALIDCTGLSNNMKYALRLLEQLYFGLQGNFGISPPPPLLPSCTSACISIILTAPTITLLV